MCHMPFRNHSIRTCTCARFLRIVVAVAYAAEHQELEQTNRPKNASVKTYNTSSEILLGQVFEVHSTVVVDLLRRDDDTDQASGAEVDKARVPGVVGCHSCMVELHGDIEACSDQGLHHKASKEDRLGKLAKWKDLLVLLR